MSFQEHFAAQPPREPPQPSGAFPPASLLTLIPDAPGMRSSPNFAEANGGLYVSEKLDTASSSSVDDNRQYEQDLEKQGPLGDDVDGEAEKVEEPVLQHPQSEMPRPVNPRLASKTSVNNVSSIPNGGLVAWLQVLGAWCLFFNTWGIINTFGAYQTFFEEGTLFQSSSSNISWIGAVQAFLLMLFGALTGPIYDAGYFRALLVTGSVMVVFGQMMLSLCHAYWQVFLAQAICIGVGAGCLFIPSVAIMSTYFSSRIPLAVGIGASGSSIGGVIYPIVFHALQPKIGFGWATRVIGFMALATLIIPLTVMKVRVLPPAKRKLFDLKAFTELPYLFYCLGGATGFAGLYVPFFYIQYYSIATNITNANLGFYILAILNAASVFGRILPNMLADKLGGLNILVPCALATSILIFCLIPAHDEAGIVIIALLYGFFSGTFVSLPPSIFVSLSPNRGVIGTRMGMGFSVISIGVLVGTPIAGAILGENNFRGIWIFGGALTMVGTMFFVAARWAKYGLSLKVKA